MASLVIAFAARKIARRPADERMTFGYGRIEIVAALINYTTLILVGVYLIYEGGMRIIDPPEVSISRSRIFLCSCNCPVDYRAFA